MLQEYLAKIVLAPFSLLYGLGVSLRDFFYRKGLLKGFTFNVPLISVGNLSVGGAGKSPHIEYLVRWLRDYVRVATLSRGYKRKTSGFLIAQPHHNAEAIGDEPLQFKRKFPDVMVTVSESRAYAIPEIMKIAPDTQVVLLDDAFQHRSVEPGLNILLTEYNRPFTRDYLLPMGRLREWRSAYQRADVIIVTKCPADMDEAEIAEWKQEIQLFPHQQLFFSYYEYGLPYLMTDPTTRLVLEEDSDILLVSAIANTDYLLDYLEPKVNFVKSLNYEDHHYFTRFDVERFHTIFKNMTASKKLLLTTEKDAMRLELHQAYLSNQHIPVFVLPVEVKFHFGAADKFRQLVQDYLIHFRV